MSLHSDLTSVLTPFADSINVALNGEKTYNSWVSGYYDLSNSPTSIDAENDILVNTNYACQAIPCQAGDIFYYTGRSTTKARIYAFLSASSGENNIISIGTYDTSGKTDYIILAPEDAVLMLTNIDVRQAHRVYKKNQYDIRENTDLDDLITVGDYMCRTQAIRNTVANVPSGVKVRFVLNVKQVMFTNTNTKRFVQRITTISTAQEYSCCYERTYSIDEGFSDWVEVYNGKNASKTYLDIRGLEAIPAGTDLNDIHTRGTYYSSSVERTQTLINQPLFHEASFALYVIGTNTSTSEAYENSYITQIVFPNYTGLAGFFIRHYNHTNTDDWSDWEYVATTKNMYTPDVIDYNGMSWEYSPDRADVPDGVIKTINVATINVAHYHDTFSSTYLGDDPKLETNWKKWLMKNQPNLLFLQECEDYIDEDRTKSAFDHLYEPFFDADHNIDEGVVPGDRDDVSRRKILNNLGWNTEAQKVDIYSLDSEYPYHVWFNWVVINDRQLGKVLLINCHNFANTRGEDKRVIDRAHFLDVLADFILNGSQDFDGEYDYLIIGGDFNVNTTTDRANIHSFCETVDVNPINGGILGWFATHSPYSGTAFRSFDNIMLSKNIRINNIECDPHLTTSWEIYSDHTPVVATISFIANNQS